MKKYINFILDLMTIDKEIDIIHSEEVRLAKFIVCEDKPAILINKNKLKDEVELRYALTHELRHFYQWLVVYDEKYFELENKDTRLIWKDNFKTYTPLENSSKYTNQPLEVDAVCFTQLIMYSIYGYMMNDFKKNDATFIQRFRELSNDFTSDEIIDVMKYHKIKRKMTH